MIDIDKLEEIEIRSGEKRKQCAETDQYCGNKLETMLGEV